MHDALYVKYVHYVKFQPKPFLESFDEGKIDFIEFQILLASILWRLRIFPRGEGAVMGSASESVSLQLNMMQPVHAVRIGMSIEVSNVDGGGNIAVAWPDEVFVLKPDNVLRAMKFISHQQLFSPAFCDDEGYAAIGLFIVNHGPITPAGHAF